MKKTYSIILSLFLAIMILTSCSANPGTESNNQQPILQTHAADSLLNDNGQFGNSSEGSLRVGFIGGSLTDGESYTTEEGYSFGGKEWTDTICKYLEEKFPNRNIIPHNSGYGGTTSDFGALRIQETILNYNPDIVFIEFSVNDAGFSTREDSQKYMEAMVRMTENMNKVPVIVFLYTPSPTDINSNSHIKWLQGVNWKQEIADYYGLGSINIYDFMQNEYAKTTYPTFLEYLESESSYRGSAAEGFDVHGGYEYYSASIIEALEKRPTEIITRTNFNEDWFENNLYKDSVYIKYDYIKARSNRLTYEGDWMLVNLSNVILTPDYFDLIPWTHDEYPAFTPSKRKDFMAATSAGASVTFTTDADAVFMVSQGITDTHIMTASIYIDGVFSGTCESTSYAMIAKLDGQTHVIKIITDNPTVDEPLFWSSNYVEAYTVSHS